MAPQCWSALAGHFGFRDCCLPALQMTSFIKCGMLHVVGKLQSRAFRNAKFRGEQRNGSGDMALQSGQNFRNRECCLQGHRECSEGMPP